MSTEYGILASHESGFVSVPLSLMLVTYRKDNFAEKKIQNDTMLLSDLARIMTVCLLTQAKICCNTK